ncbi:MAG TPA: DMT family transporter [Ramlibacter sp.]|nr:DMT family transporter [Ramlibacter sp.]
MQALWMILASLFFSGMAVCVKYASAWFNSAELVFYRGALGIVLIWAFARHRGVSLRTRYPGMHAWRSAVGVLSMGAWFYAIAHLPLATAMTLNYMSSVWVAGFLAGGAVLFWQPGRGRAGPRQAPLVLSVLAGFAGVVLMLRPTIEQQHLFAAVIGLLSGLTAAFVYLQLIALGRLGEPDTRTVFYFAVGSTAAGAIAMLGVGLSRWSWAGAAWLVPMGLLASLGQLAMTRAYNRGSTLVVASLQYSGVLFGAIFGVTLFGDRITASGWSGMGLIVASGIAATVLRFRAAPDAPAEEH